jgi:uncharacterized protein (DUF58 family)
MLTRKRIFILPTGYGLLYAALLAVMLLGSINYNNSLGHLLTFLLTGVGLVAMVATHRNLSGLAVSMGEARPVHAVDTARFPVLLENPSESPRYAVALRLPFGPAVVADILPQTSIWLAPTAAAGRRGRLRPGAVCLSTGFPLGLFRAWANVDLSLQCLVYPRADPAPPLPETLATREDMSSGFATGGDFIGVRDYRPGDPARHIHWKALARSDELLTKQFAVGPGREIWLDGNPLDGLPPEERLSRLCRWILDADSAGVPYGLRLGPTIIPPDLGQPHRSVCLETLALFDGSDVR